MTDPVRFFTVAFEMDPDHAEAFEAALEGVCVSVSRFENPDDARAPWRLEGVATTRPDAAALDTALALVAAARGVAAPRAEIAELASRDWVGENLRSFAPISVGRFFVHGSHWQDGVPAGRIALRVDAGLAFGSGEHATTKGCLAAIDWLARRDRRYRPLDMGCGSGILGMAMAKTWRVAVTMADIDPVSVSVTRHNVRDNRLTGRVQALASDGFVDRRIAEAGPYDVITANILARPLRRMAVQMRDHLVPGGVAILSGLLSEQERFVLSAYAQAGMHLKHRFRVDDWTTLVVER